MAATFSGLTRRHYEALAALMRSTKPAQIEGDSHAHGRLVQWQVTREALANALDKENASFDRQRFIDACNK